MLIYIRFKLILKIIRMTSDIEVHGLRIIGNTFVSLYPVVLITFARDPNKQS
jgi:hypothetical protein